MTVWTLASVAGFSFVALVAGPDSRQPDPPAETERLVVRSADGALVGMIAGATSSVRIDPALDRILLTAGNRFTLTHNHPASTSLSVADLTQLGKPGVALVEAVGADGSVYRASAGPLYDADHFEDVAYAAAHATIERQLLAQLRGTPRADVDAQFGHLVALALDKAKVIRYSATLSTSRREQYDRNRISFGRATEAAAAAVGSARRARSRNSAMPS